MREPASHSAVTGPDSGECEFKIYGSAVEVGHDLRSATTQAWWSALPPDKAAVFSLHIRQATFIDWNLEEALMTVHRWSPQTRYDQYTRDYP